MVVAPLVATSPSPRKRRHVVARRAGRKRRWRRGQPVPFGGDRGGGQRSCGSHSPPRSPRPDGPGRAARVRQRRRGTGRDPAHLQRRRRRPYRHPPRARGHRRGQSAAPASPCIRAELIGTDAAALVARDDVDVVVEVIGGLHPAHELVETALRNGKPVVTANKALLANAGAELAEVAAAAGVDLLYEAAVAGAIPVIRPLRESLAGERIDRVMGIVNGTTNYILTRMERAGRQLRRRAGARRRSWAWPSAIPTADVEGYDAAAKAAILASAGLRERSWSMPTCTARGSARRARPTSPTPASSDTRSSFWPSPS